MREKKPQRTMEERCWSLVQNHVRQMSMMWPPAAAADARFRVARGVYRCANPPGVCLGGLPDRSLEGPRDQFDRDHVVPIVDTRTGKTDWYDYFRRALPPTPEAFQLLCRACHRAKTNRENEERREARAERKKVNLPLEGKRTEGSGEGW